MGLPPLRPGNFIEGRLFRRPVGGISVEIHEPVNVLSTMLLAITGGPKDSNLHPIGEGALEYTRPFAKHASLAWLKEFYRPKDFLELYGHAAQLSGPVSFRPRSLLTPAYLSAYEPKRMKELPAKMASFYADAKLGHFRRAYNAQYTLAAADVGDAVHGARIEAFLEELYGPFKYKLVAVPVPTHPFTGGATAAMSGWESFAFLHPPKVPPGSEDPVAWSFDPQRTQVLVQHELSHALHNDAVREHRDLAARLGPVLARIPRDSPFARAYAAADLRFAELFIRGSSVVYLRRTRGDEEAMRWLEDQERRLGTTLVRDVSLAIEEYLAGRRWSDLHAFLSDLPNVLRA